MLEISSTIRFSYFQSLYYDCDICSQVTGAGRGLGRGLAVRFAKEGAKVAVVDVYPTPALDAAKEIGEAGGIAKVILD